MHDQDTIPAESLPLRRSFLCSSGHSVDHNHPARIQSQWNPSSERDFRFDEGVDEKRIKRGRHWETVGWRNASASVDGHDVEITTHLLGGGRRNRKTSENGSLC